MKLYLDNRFSFLVPLFSSLSSLFVPSPMPSLLDLKHLHAVICSFSTACDLLRFATCRKELYHSLKCNSGLWRYLFQRDLTVCCCETLFGKPVHALLHPKCLVLPHQRQATRLSHWRTAETVYWVVQATSLLDAESLHPDRFIQHLFLEFCMQRLWDNGQRQRHPEIGIYLPTVKREWKQLIEPHLPVPYQMTTLEQTIQLLHDDGYLYTTVDDDHYQVLEPFVDVRWFRTPTGKLAKIVTDATI